MTETMKKTDEAIARFKPPFEAKMVPQLNCWEIIDSKNVVIGTYEWPAVADLVVDALNFYYARKGERE